jgi:hypothetical protein
MMLEAIAPGIWTRDYPLRLLGADVGSRTAIVALKTGGLALISPGPIDEPLARELADLGGVRALIAPNAFHHSHLIAAAHRYPEAICFLARGVEAKLKGRPDGEVRTLGGEPDPLWARDLEPCTIEGAPRVNETVFFHPSSKTLILTDLCFHFDPPPAGWTGIFLRLAGVHGRLGVSRLMRALLRDRAAVRASLEQLLEWDFERIVVTHGSILREDARRRFREATADL